MRPAISASEARSASVTRSTVPLNWTSRGRASRSRRRAPASRAAPIARSRAPGGTSFSAISPQLSAVSRGPPVRGPIARLYGGPAICLHRLDRVCYAAHEEAPRMVLQLDRETEAIIQRIVEAGWYPDAEAVVREAVRRLNERHRRLTELREA